MFQICRHCSYPVIVCNMVLCFSSASTEIILDLVNKLQPPNVALVHQMPFVCDRKGFAATIEKVHNSVCDLFSV